MSTRRHRFVILALALGGLPILPGGASPARELGPTQGFAASSGHGAGAPADRADRPELLTWNGLPPSPAEMADRKAAAALALGLDDWAARELWDPDSSGYDAIYVDLLVEPLWDIEGLSGLATWTLVITDPTITALDFDFTTSLTIHQVLVNSQPASYTHADDRLRLELPGPVAVGDTVSAAVGYRGVPELGFLWGFDYREHDGVPCVFTNCEPIAARTWWPCKDRPDDKFTADLTFIVPDTMIAASNGTLVERIPGPGDTMWFRWNVSYPITTYLVSLTATNFVEFGDTYVALDGVTEMPLAYYAYPEHLEGAQDYWAFTPEAIHVLAQLYGEYPFLDEKYGMVEYPWGGAMEHQTLSSMGDYFQVLPERPDWVIVHELAHQWWGNLVTCGTWRDIWLNEGFATYAEGLWAEHLGGPDSLRAVMLAKARDRFPGSCYDPDFLFNSTVYRKGAWVMHMLRHVVGDETFFAGLQLWGERFAYASAVTEDLRAVFEEAWGAPLDWFFEQWVYGEGQPRYRVHWNPVASSTDGTTIVVIDIGQTHNGTQYFKMPLDAVFTLTGGDTFTTVLWDSLPDQQFVVEVPGVPEELAIDPMNWVLGKVLFVSDPQAVAENEGRLAEEGARGEDAGSVRLGRAYPNPTRGETIIPLRPAADVAAAQSAVAGLRLRIVDPAGRVVRHLTPEAGVFRWDGRDRSNQPLPAGVYFATLEPPGPVAAERQEDRVRILLLR